MASKKKKPLVGVWPATKKSDKKPSARGKEILSSEPGSIIVRHKRKRWCLLELLEYLANRVSELEKNQCVPGAKCLFEGQRYMDEKYIRDVEYDPSDIYDE